MVGHPERFGDPPGRTTVQDNVERFLKGDQVSRRDEQWLDSGPRPEHRPDSAALVLKWSPGPLLLTRLGIGAYEARLGATDCGNMGQNAQVAGNAATPWMGDPLAIHQEDVRRLGKQTNRLQEGRGLTEGEKT